MVRVIRFVLLDVPLALRGAFWRAAVRLMGGRLGRRARVYGGARIVMASRKARIEIGEGFRILRNAVVNTLPPEGTVRLGRYVHLGETSMVTAAQSVEIGDDVVIGPQTIVVDAHHCTANPDEPIRVQGIRAKPIRIDQGAWLAAHVTVLGGVTIGCGAVVGAGSVVTHDIPPFAIAAGVPARVIGQRPQGTQE